MSDNIIVMLIFVPETLIWPREGDREAPVLFSQHAPVTSACRLAAVRNMAAVSKYLTAKNSSIAGGVLLVLYLLKQRRRSSRLNRCVTR